ncbi:MAG: hypothetical protein J5895_01375 [Alphaproteobacteria bacterium]|nr:hypothetical protein [Alphaproteobacteria bacterium]
MPKPLRSFKNESDLLKKYREAVQRAKYLSDIDDKLLSYNEVINFCADSKKCAKTDSVKRNQVLFWTYNQLGDLFLQKNEADAAKNMYVYAVQYFQNALNFARSGEEEREVLQKMLDVYGVLNDEYNYKKTFEALALVSDDVFRRQAFLALADSARDLHQEAYYLEKALNYIDKENMTLLEKCKDNFDICARLLEIYQALGNEKSEARIKEIKQKAGQILN